jgi:hypothetical protein
MFSKIYDNSPVSRSKTSLSCYRRLRLAFCAVVTCLIGFSDCFSRFFAWCFSMLLEVPFLSWGQYANGVLKLVSLDGVENLD